MCRWAFSDSIPGQVFFPETILELVNDLPPYTLNKLDASERIRNADDSIYNEEGANGYTQEVVVQYLGESIADGILAYISVGIDVSANYSMSIGTGGGAPGGGQGGAPPSETGGVRPTGAVPSGSAPGGVAPTSSAV